MKFFLLDKQQNIIGRLSEEYILEATFTEEINTAGELLITLPAKKRLSGNVIHVLITNPSKDHSYLMFKIIKETVKDEEVEYTAVESAYDELTSYGYIQDKRPTANAQTITEMILKDTRWHVGEIPDTSEAFISFYYLSVLDCLKKIVQTFDFEIGFDVLINDDENQITDRRVNFYIKQGEQTGKRFEYGSNLLSVKQEQDTQNIYTALVGRGKGVQVSGGDDDNTPDGYGRRITFADIEWSKSNGDPLDKPKGQEWLEDPDATKQLGFSDDHMRIGLEVFEDVDDPKILLQKTYEALKTAERPQVQFSASVINTGELHLGDRVGITRNDIGIAYETRVFKVQHNLLDETQNKIDLGDNLEQTNNLSYQVSALQSEVTNNTEGIITVTQSANGKNKVYYSSTMPATGSNGDVWYKDLGNGETEMYIYDNGWQLVISTENLHKIEDEVKQQQTALNQAVQDANAASAKADGLVAEVGDANTNAQKALATAQQNQADLAQTKYDLQNAKNQLSNVQIDLTNTKSTLSGAVSNISQAQADIKGTEQGLQGVKSDLTNTKQQMANDEKSLSDLTKKAQEQGQTIVNIQETQLGLSADVADVKGNVSSLKEMATVLEATVKDNQGNISKLQDTASSLQASIKDNQGNISKLQGTANSLQSSIQNNKNDISNIKQTAGSIESTVASMQDAGENLIINSNFSQGNYHWILNGFQISNDVVFRNSRILSITQSGLTSPNYREVDTTDKIPVLPGQTISIGAWVKSTDVDSSGTGNRGAEIGVNWYADKCSGRINWNDYYNKNLYGNHDWKYMKLEGIQVPASCNYVQFHMFLTQNGTAQFALPIMVYGDKLPAWSPSPLDSATATDMSTVEQTVNGLKSIVQNNKGDISTLKQTASGLESDVQNNKNNISTIKQTADKVQSVVSNMKVGGTNLLPETQNYTNYMHWGNVEVLNDYSYNNYIFKPQTKIIHLWTGNNNPIDNAYPTPDNKPVHIIQGNQYTFSAYIWHYGDESQANELITLYANNGNKTLELGTVTTTLRNEAVPYHFTFTAQQTGDYTRFRVVHRNGSTMSGGSMFIAEMKLEEGNVATDWSPSPYDLASQSDLSSVEQTISSLTSTVQSHSGQISVLKQTANSLTSQISNANNDISSLKQTAGKIQSTVSSLKIGGTNLLPETQNYNGYLKWGNVEFSDVYNDGNYTFSPRTKIIHLWTNNNNPVDNACPTPDNKPVNLIQGRQYTFSAYIWHCGDETQASESVILYANNGSKTVRLGTITTTLTNVATVYKLTFTVSQTGNYTRFRVIHDNSSEMSGGSIFIAEMKLEEGNVATDWSLSPDDLASQTDMSSIEQTVTSISSIVQSHTGDISLLKQTASSLTSQIMNANNDISSLKQTASSLTSQIGNANNDISSLKQRADSIESNVSDNKNNISDLRQTANSLQSNIQSKADISQVTQLSNAIQSTVQTIGPVILNGNFSDTDPTKYYIPWDNTKDYKHLSINSKQFWLDINGTGNDTWKYMYRNYMPVNPQLPFSLTGKAKLNWGSGNLVSSAFCYIHFYDANKNEVDSDGYYLPYDNNNQWQGFNFTVGVNSIPSNTVYARFELVLQVGGSSNRVWLSIDDLNASSGGDTISSKISQMTDDINLRVQKGDLISQINIEAGKTLIQSKNLYLDASTVTFSGSAFIPSAAITDLSADKITAGTLNAGNVNIINLDVNKLVGNTTEFVRSGWTNAYGSHVQIDGGGMSVSYGDWKTTFDTSGMKFVKGNEQLGGFTSLGMAGQPDWFEGTTMYAGGNAEYLAFSAQDYKNISQSQIPIKAIWLRNEFNGAGGIKAGWNFCDKVWAGQIGMDSIQYQDWNIHFEKVTGSNGFSALTLVSGSGNGFYWGSDGSFGYVTGHGGLHNVRGSQIVYDINQNGGTCSRWSGVN